MVVKKRTGTTGRARGTRDYHSRMAKSSKQWLRRHVTDPYVRKAKEQGYRSRAAFKLLELNDQERLLKPGMTIVDLGAAPGGWSQVAAQKVGPKGRVFAIDLLPMDPISGVTVLRADFRDDLLIESLRGAQADAVLSDVSPNLSGIPLVDQARALELSGSAIDFCAKALKPEGVFVVKAFQGEAFEDLMKRLKGAFSKVKVVKPAASRGESAETYVVARSLLKSGKTT
ncbi:MAG TPA: RlmE family RNA methyltransferase [Burkholderiales bacterium]|nr:RlmE family RNA methyltransferase [Burkholderiales bacterium]